MTPSSEVSTPLPSSISIPLPAARPPETPTPPSGTHLGPVLVFFVWALAFLLASFPARNSDLLLHLARGRILAHGGFPSTTDPDLAFDLWGNQTWLYDLFCYGCYQVLGGAGLVVVKALLAAGIALLLLRQSRSVPGWCMAALCTSLALLTMSRYLALQPATLSFLLFALALALLRFPKAADKDAPPPLFSWPLLLLFVAWANADRWFLLGLGVAALVWLGEVVDAAFETGASSKRWPIILLRRGLVLVVLAAACLLNPSHINAFVLADELRGIGLNAGQVISPFQGLYYIAVGWDPSTLAYFFLLGLSLLSFAATLPQWRWRRFLPWLGLALLSALQARAIPFFAVVAGPVLAWNIADVRAGRFKRALQWEESQQLVRLGQVLSVAAIVLLVVCAWPGWLQSPPYGSRRWALDLPPSLERGAAAVQRLRQQGKLAVGSSGLHVSAETVSAFAWYAPTEKRLRLTAHDSMEELPRRVRSAAIDHVLVHDPDRARLSLLLMGQVIDAERWPLLHLEGDLAIFGWRDPTRADSDKLFRGEELDLERLAFHPAADKKAPREIAVPQTPQSWWEDFWKPAPLRSIDRDEALMYLLYAEAIQRGAGLQHMIRWQSSHAAGLVGAAAAAVWSSPMALCDAQFRLALLGAPPSEDEAESEQPTKLDRLVMGLAMLHARQRDDAPPALYYLAVRAARRAVAANPEDGPAHLLLGESYLGLIHATHERAWNAEMQEYLHLRQIQASTALNRALALRPDLVQAHLHLGQLYEEMGYFDLALKHWRTHCRMARELGPPRGISQKDFQARQVKNEERVEQMAQRVQKQENAITLGSADRSLRDSAILSFQKGLAGKALDLLLESDLSAFGTEGMELELELLLGVGRARDVHEWLIPQYENKLGGVSYHWFHARALAAMGDYLSAEEECGKAASALVMLPGSAESIRLRELMALKIGNYLLDGQRSPEATFANLRATRNQWELTEQLQHLANRLKRRAELSVLRGMIALEEGESNEAAEEFRTALRLWKDEKTAASGGGLNFHGRIIAQDYLRRLE